MLIFRLLRFRWGLLVCIVALSIRTVALADGPSLTTTTTSVESTATIDAHTPVELVVDHFIDAQLQTLQLQPAGQISDASLLRRLSLDLVGRIPTNQEVHDFVSSDDADKRARWIDQLLSSTGFARHQIDELDALLMYPDGGNLRDYLSKAIDQDRRWDQMFRELIIADQSDDAMGASAFLKARLKDTDKMTNEVSVRFFGVNVSCAQCHDHPLVSDWTQDHYYGMKSFFSRTFENGGFLAEREYGSVEYTTTRGEQRKAKLMFLTGEVLDEPTRQEQSEQDKQAERKRLEEFKKDKKPPPAPEYSRRARMAEVGLGESGRYWLAKSLANRLWARFFGFGLVMPVDQMHSENPASHPELLEWLARDLMTHNFDMKRTIRGLVLSRAYSRNSRWTQGDSMPEPSTFAVSRVRPLTPLQLGASLKVATLDPNAIDLSVPQAERNKRADDAAQAGRGLSSRFEMPREDLQISVSEALFLNNNPQVVRDLLSGGLVN
ncbi:MAG: DUF1549 domain-containing protein, partial [Pirellula sp.]